MATIFDGASTGTFHKGVGAVILFKGFDINLTSCQPLVLAKTNGTDLSSPPHF